MEFWFYFQFLFVGFYIVRSSNQLQSTIAETDMPENPHFESVPSWHAAAEKLNFKLLVPRKNFRHKLKSLSIYVRDHKMRQLPIGKRSLVFRDVFCTFFVHICKLILTNFPKEKN